MNRRTTISKIIGKSAKAKKMVKPMPTAPISLDPFNGEWTFEKAAHLLRRSMFGPKKEEIEKALELGLSGTIDLLFQEQEMPAPPILSAAANVEDPRVPEGETWVDTVLSAGDNFLGPKLRSVRERSLNAWNTRVLVRSDMSIREKMTLFWHNHFVIEVATVRDPRYLYSYLQLLRENATGNFKNLVKKVTLDKAMLRYLNGDSNSEGRPNENYARELLELFTIGKGAFAGPGDYSTFTEDDVIEAARVLTGWRTFDYNSTDPEEETGVLFVPTLHDTGRKRFSHRFNSSFLNNEKEEEYASLIDIIFEQREVARFISKKLYRWFVYSTIDDSIDNGIIEPMAQLLIDNDFEIEPVLKTLLSSQHFYDSFLQGGMIKNPIDFVIGMARQFDLVEEIDDRINEINYIRIHNLMAPLQMQYLGPPDVAGWKAYYQEPAFYQTWISSATIIPRLQTIEALATVGIQANAQRYTIDVLALAGKIENAIDPNILIEGLAKIFFPRPISEKQKTALKEALIPGLPDFEWTVEYSDYLAAPSDEDLRTGAENRLRALVKAMLSMSEYQLM